MRLLVLMDEAMNPAAEIPPGPWGGLSPNAVASCDRVESAPSPPHVPESASSRLFGSPVLGEYVQPLCGNGCGTPVSTPLKWCSPCFWRQYDRRPEPGRTETM